MYYLGTNSNLDFKTLQLNDSGLLWMTQKIKQGAFKYASKYYNKGIKRIFHINLSLDRAVGLNHISTALFSDNYTIEEMEYL